MATDIKLRENVKIRKNQDFETKGYRLEVHLTSPHVQTKRRKFEQPLGISRKLTDLYKHQIRD
jgi:hypothetical protein